MAETIDELTDGDVLDMEYGDKQSIILIVEKGGTKYREVYAHLETSVIDE